jgi:hypothetical protein
MTVVQRLRLRVFLTEWKTVVFIAVVFAVVAFFMTSVVVLAVTKPPGAGP